MGFRPDPQQSAAPASVGRFRPDVPEAPVAAGAEAAMGNARMAELAANPAAPLAGASKPGATLEDRALAPVSGINQGLAGYAGLPVDTALNVWDLGKAAIGTVQSLATGKPPSEMFDPADRSQYPLSGQWNVERVNEGGIETQARRPDDVVSRYLHAAGTGIPAALSGGAGAPGMIRQGAAGVIAGLGGEASGEFGADESQQALIANALGIAAGQQAAKPQRAKPVVESTATPEGKAKLADMRAKGIKVTPKEASQMTGDKNYVGRALQAVGGESKITKDMAAKNAPVLNDMARRAVGADSITEAGLKPVKENANAVYDEMSTIGAVQPEQALFDAIEGARGAATKSTKRNADIDKFVDGVLAEYQSGEVDAGQVVNRVRELRRDAQNSRKGEGDKRPTVQQEALGEAQRKVADALDDFLEYNAATAGKPELAEKYKQNRTRLAKVGTVEGASRAGNINAKELYDAQQKGAPLSGNLKDIADANEWAPGSTAPNAAETLMDAPGRNLSLTELPVAAVQATARHLGVNKLLQSEWYQSLIGGPTGGPVPLEYDPNPNAFRPPARAPEAEAPPTGIPQTNSSSMLRAQQLAGDLSLVDDVQNPQQLPAAPDQLTAEAIPASRGDVQFQPQDLGAMIESALSAQTPQAQGSMPGGNLRGVLSALGLAEDAPVNAGPARRVAPDDGIPFEQVNPDEVAPYRVNADMNFNDARPPSGVQRGAAMDTGDLELLPDQPPGPYQELPPSPGKPRRGGPPRIRQAAPAATPAPAETPLPEGLSELGALIDQMLRTPNPRSQMQNPAQQQQGQAGIVPGTNFGRELGLSLDDAPAFNRSAVRDFDATGDEPLGQRAGMPPPKRVTAKDGEGYISYIPGVNNSRQITGAFVAPSGRGKGHGKANLLALAEESAAAGETLNSDSSVSATQLAVYEKLKKAGKLDYEFADPEAAAIALKDGGKLSGDTPVILNIRPVTKQ